MELQQQPMQKLPHNPEQLAQLRNPLLANLVNSEKLLFQDLPLHGRHINATFSRDPKVIQECLDKAGAKKRKNPLSDEAKQMALDSGIIVVYQAFNRGIVHYAAENQTFLGTPLYNPTRMTWIKTSFFWMMFRCEWATRDVNQERVVAITLPIAFFDQILKMTVESSHQGGNDNNNDDEAGAGAQQGAGEEKVGGKRRNNKKDKQIQQQQEQQPENKSEKEDEEQQPITAATTTTNEEVAATSVAPSTAWSKKPSRVDPVRLQFDPAHTELGGKRDRREIQLGLRAAVLPDFHKWMICIDDITDSLVAPCRPKKFDANKSWMEHYNHNVSPAVSSQAETEMKNKKATNENDNDDGNHEAEDEKKELDEDSPQSRRSAIFQPLEELYLPFDLGLIAHLQLDTPIPEKYDEIIAKMTRK